MSQARAHDATADAIRDRYRRFFDNAFMPNIRHEQMPGADERVAYAAEFAAYLQTEARKWAKAVEISGAKAN